jgi:hypothetical protein
MNDHLSVLKSAISDVGRWTWWTVDLPEAFQVEFNGTLLWNPPQTEGQLPSSQIALRFRKPRLVYFLTMSTSVTSDWPHRLQRDEIEPFYVDHDAFTLTSVDLCAQLVGKAVSIEALVGEPTTSALPASGEALLGFRADSVGLVVAAESMGVINHQGELDERAVLESSRKWWEYWREYWQRKDTAAALPYDYLCEITIPAG